MSAAAHEGAERDPFGLTASPDDYVPTAAIERVLADAVAALHAGRVPVISGPTGLGKSLALQLLGRACAERSQALYVPFCSLTPEDLASLVLGLLDWAHESDPELELLEVARRVAADGRRLLLLVDDAASLPGDSAAQLAHWANASGGALEVALAGLPGASLRHARDAFGDRSEEILLVEGLQSDEIRRYVAARLEAAGAEPQTRAAFDDAALAELERVSGGNPRRLNLAAQAIVRNAYGRAEAAGAESEAPEAAAPPPAAHARPSFEDLAAVGEYRFVRGRFIDPETGDVLASPAREAISQREEMLAPKVERVSEAPDADPLFESSEPGLDTLFEEEEEPDTLFAGTAPVSEPSSSFEVTEPDAEPETLFQQPDFGSDVVPPEPALEDDSRYEPRMEPPPPRSRSGTLRWVAAGVAVLAFAAGLWTQLAGDPKPVVPPPPQASRPDIFDPPAAPAAAIEETAPIPEPAPAPAAAEVAELPIEARPEAAVSDVERPDLPPDVPTPVARVVEPQRETEAPTPPEGLAGVEPPASLPEPAPVAEPTPALEPTPQPEAVPAPPPPETVAIAINATPWAVIEIDGVEIGETPLAGIQLTTGRHRFRARMPDGSVRERVVRIDPDTPTVVFE